MLNKIKFKSGIAVMLLVITATLCMGAIQGDVVINAVDPTNAAKMTRVVGTQATGIRVTVMNAATNPGAVLAAQPTASLLNATVSQALVSTIVHGQVDITNAATIIIATNTARKSVMIRNLTATDVYIGDSTLTVATGIPIKQGDTYPLIIDKTSVAIYGIVSAGTGTVAYLEQ
jgi:hypothetical protein